MATARALMRSAHARMTCVTVLLVLPAVALSQPSTESRLRAELRTDAIFARATLLQAGLGAGFRLGYNVRAHAVAAAGTALKGRASETSVRGDATLRLLLDPFGETTSGLSVGGGLSVLYDGFEGTRPVGLIVVGLEGAPRAPLVWAVEVALGGGARVGFVLRRRARGYR